jgi:hypothetical protein
MPNDQIPFLTSILMTLIKSTVLRCYKKILTNNTQPKHMCQYRSHFRTANNSTERRTARSRLSVPVIREGTMKNTAQYLQL